MDDALKLEIKKDSIAEAGQIYGRENEIKKLVRILGRKEGSASLISGDRGSGKTSTIKEAIKKLGKNKFRRRASHIFYLGFFIAWMRNYVVHLDVPLVPSNIEQEELRTNVLRLMVQSLVSEYSSSNIFIKAKYPIGYRKRLNALESVLMYKSITRKSSKGLKATYKAATGNISQSYSYEYNLAYTDIELRLKDFFTKYSKHLEFVIVFDELDKYQEDDADGKTIGISPHQYIRELKNLFTVTYAKFIFTSTEDYYQEINENLNTNATELLHYKFNLFTHKLLINQLDPHDYSEFLRGILHPINSSAAAIAEREYPLFEAQMNWHTHGYPFLTKKKIHEFAEDDEFGRSFIDLINVNERFTTYGTKAASLQYLISYIYGKYVTKNELTNRYLYKSLRKIGDVFYSGREPVVNKSNFYALLFSDIDFGTRSEKEALYQSEFNQNSHVTPLSESERRWEHRLDHLDGGIKTMINEAITELIWYLDSFGVITSDSSDIDSISMTALYLTKYREDEFTEIITALPTMYEFTVDIDNDEVVDSKSNHDKSIAASKRRLIYLRKKLHDIIDNTGLENNIPLILSLPNEGGLTASGVAYEKGWALKSTMDDEYIALVSYQKELHQKIAELILNRLANKYRLNYRSSQKLSDSTAKALPAYEIGLRFDRNNIKILINPTREIIEKQIDDETVMKTIVITPSDYTKQVIIRNSNKLKYFHFSNDRMSNFKRISDDLTEYINKLTSKNN